MEAEKIKRIKTLMQQPQTSTWMLTVNHGSIGRASTECTKQNRG